jgi:hypothetical protein
MDRQAAWIVVYELRASHGLPNGEDAFMRSTYVDDETSLRARFPFLGISRCQPMASRLITVQHIAIHGPRPRSDARAHIAADRAHQEERDDRATPSVEATQRTRQRW